MKTHKSHQVLASVVALTVTLGFGTGATRAAESANQANSQVESLDRMNKRMENAGWSDGLIRFGKTLLNLNQANATEDAKIQPHVTMGPDLAALRRDFNAAAGSVRLLFLVGPTCGACLVGLERVAEKVLTTTDDPRVHTYVVHVPALGATEEDVGPAVQLLTGKNITHYWEDTGIIGALYQKVLGRNRYVWDEWMIYGPAARWQGDAPPKPDYWVHRMDYPEEFAAKTRERLAILR